MFVIESMFMVSADICNRVHVYGEACGDWIIAGETTLHSRRVELFTGQRSLQNITKPFTYNVSSVLGQHLMKLAQR